MQGNGEVKEDPLVQAIILLLVRLGGVVNRKIFIPGESREKENSREFFIASNTLKLLITYKESFQNLCIKEIDQLYANMNEKDW